MKEFPQNQQRKLNPAVSVGNCYRDLMQYTYRRDEICVYFKNPLSDEERRKKMEAFGPYIKEPIKVRACKNCDPSLDMWFVEIWKAKGIHTSISGPVIAGVNPVSGTVGEEYSLNFFNSAPFDTDIDSKDFEQSGYIPTGKENKILIAVLDTGVDTKLVNDAYLWHGDHDNNTKNDCYPVKENKTTGWNFLTSSDDPNSPVYGSPNVYDDNEGKHGSIVSQYIINEFIASKNYNVPSKNSLELMTLKTHDANGQGDLFGIICALHFAIAKGAKIINASWGFYLYEQPFPVPYFQKLITEVLQKRGILFVTAAGNENCRNDQIANAIFFNQTRRLLTPEELRNLEIHNFYPAVFSNSTNNVITVTTTDGRSVSSSQNYSEAFVDLGIEADKVKHRSMKFRQPFGGANSPDELISGSSFATAIATGKIGAFCDVGAPLFKEKVLAELEIGATKPKLIKNGDPLKPELIKRGRFMGKPHKP